jgi:hypothetical protein
MRALIAGVLAMMLSNQDFKPENKPENLRLFFEKLMKAQRDGDEKTALALTKSLFLDEKRLRKALKDDAPAATVEKIVAMHQEMLKAEDAKMARAFAPGDPKRTEVQVHAATTEEIVKYEKDGVAFREFPGGAKQLAEAVLRPGTAFYEVEVVEPGKDSGMKFHLFFWDGEKWGMLGPAWRALKSG